MLYGIIVLLFLTNFFTSIICHTKCKEYIIIMKEISCPSSLSPIREPIKLEGIEWNHDDCFEDSVKILSYDENNFNKSYLLKFDYIGFESVCIPIFKSKKLLEHIKIDSENITTREDEGLERNRHELNEASDIENYDTNTPLLECLIKNYTDTCDKQKSKATLEAKTKRNIVDIDLYYISEITTNSTERIYNKTNASLLFEQCALREQLCMNSSTIDDYTESYHSITTIVNVSLANEDKGLSPQTKSNYTDDFNCTNIITNRKDINISHVKALTYSIIKKYACPNVSKDIINQNNTLFTYNVRLYIPANISVINTKLQYTNCHENFESINNKALSIDCNIIEVMEKHMKENITKSNNNSTHANFLEETFNNSLIYHCKLKKSTIMKESYSETIDKFNTYKVFDFQKCTDDYKNNDKNASLDGSKVLIITNGGNKKNFTNLEDFESSTDSESIKVHFISNNVSDCSGTIPFNITKGRIISLWSDEDKETIGNELIETSFKLNITNCYNYTTKTVQNDDTMELDIILMNTNNATSNQSITNDLRSTLCDFPKRTLLECSYFTNELNHLHNLKSAIECKFIKSDNKHITATETPTSKSPIDTKHDGLSDYNDNLFNKKINTTGKSEKNNFGNERESENKSKLQNSKTEHNAIHRNETEDDILEQAIYYISPKVYIVAVVSITAVVASVLIYALCLFKSEEKEYHVAPTRDWSTMDETEF